MSKVLYSFDIFDTLITRTTATSRGTIAILQNEIKKYPELKSLPEYVKNNFYFLRNECEFYARDLFYRNKKTEEVSFEQIYNIFQENYNLTNEQRNCIEKLEIDIEIKNLLPIRKNIDLLKDLINKKETVILISDMYFDSNTIRQLLLSVDEIFKNIKIYSSCDSGKSKHSGNLFLYIKEIENVDFTHWYHIGDNKISDYETPKQLGIKAKQFELPKFLQIENEILNKYPNNAYIQLLLGCSKNVIINNLNPSKEFILGATLGSQILVPYVFWILDFCNNKKINELYFIARDGYILKRIADYIISYKQLSISTKYIYGSRIAWQMPAIEENFELIKPLILQYSDNIDNLSQILSLSKEDIKKFLPKKYQKCSEKFFNRNIEDINNYLLQNDFFKKHFLKINKGKKDLLLKYLQQELNLTNDSFAFVDLCGSGHTQNCLAEILSNIYTKKIKTFYFRNGLRKVFPNKVERYTYFLNRKYISVILELFARAPHGQTMGYKILQEKIVPALESTRKNASFDFNEYEKGIMEYIDILCKNYILPSSDISLFTSIYDYITQNIDAELANILGKI